MASIASTERALEFVDTAKSSIAQARQQLATARELITMHLRVSMQLKAVEWMMDNTRIVMEMIGDDRDDERDSVGRNLDKYL